MNRPDTLAEVATRLIAGEDRHPLFAGFLDNFYMRPEQRQSMLDPEAELTGDPILDATIGGIGEHLARRWHLRMPAWTDHPARFLKRAYFPTPLDGLNAMLTAQIPPPFPPPLTFTPHHPL